MATLVHWNFVGSVLVAIVLAATAIPVTKRIAIKLRAVGLSHGDPDSRPVPLLAGIPILLAVLASLELFSTVPLWMLTGSAGLVIVGAFDDIVVLRAFPKLLLQAVILAAVTRTWDTPTLFSSSALNTVAVVVWLLATVNAFNLIDGLDGLAGGVGIVIAIAITAIGATHHNPGLVYQGLAIVGALAGFLFFNFPRASIFMGDCGSLPLGFLLGAIALNTAGVTATSKLTLYVLPALLMLVPLLDMGVVSISRMATSHPVTQRGHDHSHHKLLALGLPDRTASEVCWVIAALSGICAFTLASMTWPYAVMALPLIAALFGLIAFFMIDLTFDSAELEDTYGETRGIARLLLNFGYKRRVTEVVLDLVLISAAYLGAFLIRLDFVINAALIDSIVASLPYVAVVSLAAFFAVGMYRGIWRYAGLTDIPRFAYAAMGAGVAVVVEAYFVRIALSGSIVVLFVLLLFNLLAASRFSFKGFRVVIARVAPPLRRVLVVGAGAIGEAAVRFVSTSRNRGFRVVGLIDSDPFKIGSRVYGSVVLGTVANLPQIHASTHFNQIFVASDSLAADQLESLLEFARTRELPLLRFSIELNEITRPAPAEVPDGKIAALRIVDEKNVVASN